ncbi:MAG: hypothetical protein JKY45_09475 [Emcibacter sp.]|nr:hypothetical protein [Emcibacter sp.]
MTDLSTLSHDDYHPLVGEVFKLDAAGDTLELVLDNSKTLGEGQREGGPFSLLFKGPKEPMLAQGTFPISHDKLGSHELFIVPVGEDNDAVHYEAVFG